jgi:hypothetical protein
MGLGNIALWGLGLFGASKVYEQIFGEGSAEGLSEEELQEGLENSPMDMESFIQSDEGQALMQQAQAVGQAQGQAQAQQQGNQFQRDLDTPLGRSNQLYAEASQMADNVKSGTRTLPNREKMLRKAMAHTETLKALKDSQMRTRDFDKAKTRWDNLGMDRGFNELSEQEKQKFSDGVKHNKMKWDRADWENPQPKPTTSDSATATATPAPAPAPAPTEGGPSTLDKIKEGIKDGFDTIKGKMLPEKEEGEGTVLKPEEDDRPISEIYPRPPSIPDEDGMGPEYHRQRPPGDYEENPPPMPKGPVEIPPHLIKGKPKTPPSTPPSSGDYSGRNPDRVGEDGKIKPIETPRWFEDIKSWYQDIRDRQRYPNGKPETTKGTMGGAFDAGDVGLRGPKGPGFQTLPGKPREPGGEPQIQTSDIKYGDDAFVVGEDGNIIDNRPKGPGVQTLDGFGKGRTELPPTDPFGQPLDPNTLPLNPSDLPKVPEFVPNENRNNKIGEDLPAMPLAPGQKEFLENEGIQNTTPRDYGAEEQEIVNKDIQDSLPNTTIKPGPIEKPERGGVHRGRLRNKPLEGPPGGAIHKAPGRPEGVVFNDPKVRKAERDRFNRETMEKVPIVSLVGGEPKITGYKTKSLMRKEMGGKSVKWDEPKFTDPSDNPFGDPSGYAKFDGTIPKMDNGQVEVPKNTNVATSSDFDDPLKKKRKKRIGQIA